MATAGRAGGPPSRRRRPGERSRRGRSPGQGAATEARRPQSRDCATDARGRASCQPRQLRAEGGGTVRGLRRARETLRGPMPRGSCSPFARVTSLIRQLVACLHARAHSGTKKGRPLRVGPTFKAYEVSWRLRGEGSPGSSMIPQPIGRFPRSLGEERLGCHILLSRVDLRGAFENVSRYRHGANRNECIAIATFATARVNPRDAPIESEQRVSYTLRRAPGFLGEGSSA